MARPSWPGAADGYGLEEVTPSITAASLESLLSIMASSMLVIAISSVTSMVAAYASASTTATPRSFPLVLADNVSQNALSTFLGAFIFSIVALVGMQNGHFEASGRFVLFALAVGLLGAVVLVLVRWVDRVARLGRLGETIDRIEAAAADAIEGRRSHPTLGAVPAPEAASGGAPVFASEVGYVQRVDVAALQAFAEQAGMRVRVAALPGTFATPDRPLAHVRSEAGASAAFDDAPVIRAFRLGRARVFDDDPGHRHRHHGQAGAPSPALERAGARGSAASGMGPRGGAGTRRAGSVPRAWQFPRPRARAEPHSRRGGGTIWSPGAYSFETGFLYAVNQRVPGYFQPREQARVGERFGNVAAVNPSTGKVMWTQRTEQPLAGGVLATAGGLVFAGRTSGWFDAYDAATGERLWSFRMGAGCNSAPMTYQVGGRQYVALSCGGHGALDPQGGDTVVAFALPD